MTAPTPPTGQPSTTDTDAVPSLAQTAAALSSFARHGAVPMTPPDPAALRALAEAATPGPWAIDESPGFGYHVRTDGTTYAIPPTGEPVADAALDADAALIVAARNALPGLLDENEELRARLVTLEAENQRMREERTS